MNCSHGRPLEVKCWACVSEALARIPKPVVFVDMPRLRAIADPFNKTNKQVDKKGVLLHN